MTGFLDTNVVLRYLTGMPQNQFVLARSLIDSQRVLTLGEVILLEAAYALEAHYGLGRQQVVDVLCELVRKENVTAHHLDRDLLVEAFRLCRPSNRVSIGDALIWANVRASQPSEFRTFDTRFPRDGITVRRP